MILLIVSACGTPSKDPFALDSTVVDSIFNTYFVNDTEYVRVVLTTDEFNELYKVWETDTAVHHSNDTTWMRVSYRNKCYAINGIFPALETKAEHKVLYIRDITLYYNLNGEAHGPNN